MTANIKSPYKVAVIPGDGIGKEVMVPGIKALEACAERFGFALQLTTFDFASCDYYEKHGKMLPDDWVEVLRKFDAVYFGAVGDPKVCVCVFGGGRWDAMAAVLRRGIYARVSADAAWLILITHTVTARTGSHLALGLSPPGGLLLGASPALLQACKLSDEFVSASPPSSGESSICTSTCDRSASSPVCHARSAIQGKSTT